MNSLNIEFLAVHNILRWVIVIFGILTIVLIYSGLFNKKTWSKGVERITTFFAISLDVQLVVGLLLYFVFSSLTKTMFADISAAMQNSTLRFFGVEHVLVMIPAIIFAHIGKSIGKKMLSDEEKFKRAAIFFSFSVLLVILGIPWATRPLLPSL